MKDPWVDTKTPWIDTWWGVLLVFAGTFAAIMTPGSIYWLWLHR